MSAEAFHRLENGSRLPNRSRLTLDLQKLANSTRPKVFINCMAELAAQLSEHEAQSEQDRQEWRTFAGILDLYLK